MKCKECRYYGGEKTEGKRWGYIDDNCIICGERAVVELRGEPDSSTPDIIEEPKGEATIQISAFRFYLFSLLFIIGGYYVMMAMYREAIVISILYYSYYKALSMRARYKQMDLNK